MPYDFAFSIIQHVLQSRDQVLLCDRQCLFRGQGKLPFVEKGSEPEFPGFETLLMM